MATWPPAVKFRDYHQRFNSPSRPKNIEIVKKSDHVANEKKEIHKNTLLNK